MGNILILGGTGAMGWYLVRELQKSAHEVFVTSRTAHEDEHNIHYLLGDARNDPVFLDSLLNRRFDCIVDFMIWPTAQFRLQYRHMLESTGQYIYLSSYRVYADKGAESLTEDSALLLDTSTDKEYLNTDEYALAKARGERLLQASGRGCYTIVRPSITFSRQRFQLGTLEAPVIISRSLAGKPLLLPGDMLQKRAAVAWAGDAGRMLAALIGNERAMGEVFNVGTSESHTWAGIASYYGELLGTEVLSVPLKAYMKMVRSRYQVLYDRMYDRVLDNSKILRLMGLQKADLMPVRDALAVELKDVDRLRHSIAPDRGINRRMDRWLCLHRPWKALQMQFRKQRSPLWQDAK